MQIIIENYLIIVSIGFFVVFALIGYLVDMLRNNSKNDKTNKQNFTPIEQVQITNISEQPTIHNQENQNSNTTNNDDLLKAYDNNN